MDNLISNHFDNNKLVIIMYWYVKKKSFAIIRVRNIRCSKVKGRSADDLGQFTANGLAGEN